MHSLELYLRLIAQQFKSVLEFRSDVMLYAASMLLVQSLAVTLVWTIFRRIPRIHGWSMWEIILMIGLLAYAEGMSSLLAEGSWLLGYYINQGKLDYMLLRPVPVQLQVMSSDVGAHGLGNVATAAFLIPLALMHASVAWTPIRLGYGLALLFSIVVIKASIDLAANSVSFWLKSPSTPLPFMVHNVSEFAKYPLPIYGLPVKIVLTSAMPFAFISFFPVAYLTQKAHYAFIGLGTPAVAVGCALIARVIFVSGLKRYEGAGG
jgi:ABC-2 type transport system permease protein